jgi:spermidine synthase
MTSRLRISFGLAIVAAVTLMLELVLMRAFDAMMNSEMSHLIITCAMFSFGLSGVYASLRPLPTGTDPDKYITKLAIAFGVFALLLLPLMNLNPFNYTTLMANLKAEVVSFALMYLTLMVPFFLSGLIFTTVFSSYASQIRTLYCFDLCGAAIGCVAFIPFIPLIGPGGLLFAAMAFSFIAAVLFSGKFGAFQKALLVVAAVTAVIPFARTNSYFDFRDHENKRDVMWAKQHGMLEMTQWDPIAKIEVVREKPRLGYTYVIDQNTKKPYLLYKHVAYDGGTQSSRLFHFDGDFKRLRTDLERDPKLFVNNFWNRAVAASHWFKADKGSDVLIIGSAAGQETKAALTYSPHSVDAVEMVRAVVDLSTGRYSDFLGNIFRDPRVHPHVGEGRTFLRSTSKKYDIIQIYSNHTSSAMAAGGGAGRGVYLQTVEAYKEYFSSLKPDGILHINHHFYPRMIVTAAQAWKEMGRDDFRKHVVVYERPGLDTIPLMLIKMSPWKPEEIARLNGFMLRAGVPDKRDQFHISEDPLNPAKSFLSDEFYSGSLSPELVARIPYQITAPTDDRPYFNFLRKKIRLEKPDPANFVNDSAAGWLNSQLSGKGKTAIIPLDIAHYVVSGVVGLFFAILFVVVPLSFSSVGRKRWPGEFSSLFYFSCLGAGFIIVELTLVQVFMKLIGVPLYTYSAVIFTMLAAAGIGSNAANWLKIAPQSRWWVPYAGTLICGFILLQVYPMVFDQFLASDMAMRILIAGIMIFPISFFMGMCLPIGILAIENKPNGAIAWAWGMNGLFTTIGGLGSALLSMFLGFHTTLLIAFGIYTLAGLAFMRLKSFALISDRGISMPSGEPDLQPA